MPKKKNHPIPVFRAEHELGLAEQIRSNTSIAYMTKLEDTKLSQEVLKEFYNSVASELDEDQFDLFYLNTILVTTGWNKNNDVFDRAEVWASRYTPVHKQFNLEHDQSKIIGHMTSARAVNEKFEPIDDQSAIDDLPDKFHILTGAVIYRVLADEEAQKNINQVIEEINKGEWYVSMECLFRGFNYAITASDGRQGIIARNEESSFLTKHLRQYGGTGIYTASTGEEYTVGRCLTNITFSGKGLVRKPANPESIIFNENVASFKASFANLGYIKSSGNNSNNILINDNSNTLNSTQERVSMANENDSQTKALEQRVADLVELNKKLEDQVKQHESSATTAKINGLEADVTAKANRITQLEGDLNTTTAKVSDLENKLKDAETRATKAEKDLADAKAAERTRARVDSLIKMNAPEDEANKIVTLFADKDDEQFKTLVSLFADKWKKSDAPKVPTDVPPAKASDTKGGNNVPKNPVDDAAPEDDASLAANTNSDDSLRSSMAAVFAGFLNSDPIASKDSEQL